MRKSLALLSLLIVSLASAATTARSADTPWSLLLQAGALPAADCPRSSDMQYQPYPPYSKKWWDMAWDSEQQNTEQFRLLRQARLLMEKNGGQSGISTPHISPANIQTALRDLTPARNLANILSDGAVFSHLNGNDAQSLARLMDLMNISGCVRQCHFLIAQLVAAGIDAIATQTTEIIAPTLHLTPPARTQSAQLIAGLLNENAIRQEWRNTWANELHNAEHPDFGAGAAATQAAQIIALKPAAVQRDLALLNQACDFSTSAKSLALVNQCTWPVGGFASMDRVFVTEFRVLSERRMAAIDLAVQLYRADHGNNWPANLQVLVPAYLPSVPRDPFRSDNAPIGYKIIPHGWPDGRDRPVVYVDAGADVPHLGNYPHLGWYQSGKKPLRQYRDLTLPEHSPK